MHFYTYRLEMPGGFVYYGKTDNFRRRMNGHKSEAIVGKRPVCRAIQACGWENVKCVKMRGYETREEARVAEKRSIAFARELGLKEVVNVSGGGETGRGNRLYPHKLQPGKDTFKVYRENPRTRFLFDKYCIDDYEKYQKVMERVGARVCARFQ